VCVCVCNFIRFYESGTSLVLGYNKLLVGNDGGTRSISVKTSRPRYSRSRHCRRRERQKSDSVVSTISFTTYDRVTATTPLSHSSRRPRSLNRTLNVPRSSLRPLRSIRERNFIKHTRNSVSITDPSVYRIRIIRIMTCHLGRTHTYTSSNLPADDTHTHISIDFHTRDVPSMYSYFILQLERNIIRPPNAYNTHVFIVY